MVVWSEQTFVLLLVTPAHCDRSWSLRRNKENGSNAILISLGRSHCQQNHNEQKKLPKYFLSSEQNISDELRVCLRERTLLVSRRKKDSI